MLYGSLRLQGYHHPQEIVGDSPPFFCWGRHEFQTLHRLMNTTSIPQSQNVWLQLLSETSYNPFQLLDAKHEWQCLLLKKRKKRYFNKNKQEIIFAFQSLFFRWWTDFIINRNLFTWKIANDETWGQNRKNTWVFKTDVCPNYRSLHWHLHQFVGISSEIKKGNQFFNNSIATNFFCSGI